MTTHLKISLLFCLIILPLQEAMADYQTCARGLIHAYQIKSVDSSPSILISFDDQGYSPPQREPTFKLLGKDAVKISQKEDPDKFNDLARWIVNLNQSSGIRIRFNNGRCDGDITESEITVCVIPKDCSSDS
ncbi:MAG: hypothetical protein N0E59_15990 [Candidatus Thiodiazotropha taylori]|nr:hypothetical protein [Candidatus Thiodiazotropha taylori]MCG8112257.1 hypothetical protein [Candidatus Thiodiazotropha taylori]MCW4284615.1 hypothetical protein [Candidatus Thiodiazotropha taylori]MCW4303756.1 hypothetical protein [Candidatus Thiodiazotropha taylori]